MSEAQSNLTGHFAKKCTWRCLVQRQPLHRPVTGLELCPCISGRSRCHCQEQVPRWECSCEELAASAASSWRADAALPRCSRCCTSSSCCRQPSWDELHSIPHRWSKSGLLSFSRGAEGSLQSQPLPVILLQCLLPYKTVFVSVRVFKL